MVYRKCPKCGKKGVYKMYAGKGNPKIDRCKYCGLVGYSLKRK